MIDALPTPEPTQNSRFFILSFDLTYYEPGVKLNYAYSRFPREFEAGKAQQEIPAWQGKKDVL